MPGSNRQADIVWHVKQPNGEPGVLHIEAQSTRDDEMGQRVADYALRLHLQHELSVHSIVMYLRPDGPPPASVFGWNWNDRPSFRYEYEIIRLWEWRSEELLATPYYTLYPLAGFMRDVTVEATAEIADRIDTAARSKEEREQLTGDLALFAGMRLPWEDIYEAIRRRPMLKDLWEQSSLGKALEVIAEERGEARGEARGAENTARHMATLAIMARFGGGLDADLLEAIDNASQAACELAITHVSGGTLDEIRAAFGLAPKG
jgi:hypothetical protein